MNALTLTNLRGAVLCLTTRLAEWPCPKCNGSGRTSTGTCQNCLGSGWENEW